MAIDRIKKLKLQNYTLYIGIAMLAIIFEILCAFNGLKFFTASNIYNIISQSAMIGILGIGLSLIILAGGIDLSAGSQVALVGMMVAYALKNWGGSIFVACLAGMVIGMCAGLFNGLGVAYGRIPPFIMTLGMTSVTKGVTLLIGGGKSIGALPRELGLISNSTVFGIPIFILYLLVLYIIIIFVMSKFRYGRKVYAVGGNRKAAKLAGINVKMTELSVYVLSSLFASIVGIMMVARLQFAAATAGAGYEQYAIASAVIGGISLSGGKGSVQRTLLGSLILSVLKVGLTILNVSTYWQEIATGLIIIVAVYVDCAKMRKAE